MPKLSQLDPQAQMATQHVVGKPLYDRIDQMEFIQQRLSLESLRELVQVLQNMDEADIAHLKKAMTTSAGLISSFTTSRKSREYTRTIVLFHAVTMRLAGPMDDSEWRRVDQFGKTLYRNSTGQELQQICMSHLLALNAAFEEKKRNAENLRRQATLNSGRAKLRRDGFAKLRSTARDFKQLHALAQAKQMQLSTGRFRRNIDTLKGAKRSEVVANFLHSGIQFEKKYAPAINTLVAEFEEAFGISEDKKAERRNFKKNLAKNVFSAVKNYAPPPFNLIGVAGQLGVTLVSKAQEGASALYETFGNVIESELGEQPWAQVDDQRKDLCTEAVKKANDAMTRAENWINGDAGKSEFDLTNFDIAGQFKEARDGAFVELLNQLLALKMDLTLRPSAEYGLVTMYRSAQPYANAVYNRSIIKDDLARQMKTAFQDASDQQLTQMEASLSEIKLAPWEPAGINETLIKRYYLLFVMGMYLDAEHKKPNGADDSYVFVKVEDSFKHLLHNYGLVHSRNTRKRNQVKWERNLGISLPYSNRQTPFVSNNEEDYVRFECLARIYANSAYTPMELLCGKTTVGQVEGFLRREVVKIDAELGQVSNHSGRVQVSRTYPPEAIKASRATPPPPLPPRPAPHPEDLEF